jgi:hypothetical protein
MGLRHVKVKHLERDVWTGCLGDERVYGTTAIWEKMLQVQPTRGYCAGWTGLFRDPTLARGLSRGIRY